MGLSREPLLCLATRCPTCGAAPNLRLFPSEVERYQSVPPDQPVQTYQCMRELRGKRRCGTIYILRAKAFQFAFPEAA